MYKPPPTLEKSEVPEHLKSIVLLRHPLTPEQQQVSAGMKRAELHRAALSTIIRAPARVSSAVIDRQHHRRSTRGSGCRSARMST